MLQGKRFGSNGEVIADTKAYCEAKDKSFYKKGIEMVKKRWNKCITFEGDYVDEWSRILPKCCCFISHPTNLLSDVLPRSISHCYRKHYNIFFLTHASKIRLSLPLERCENGGFLPSSTGGEKRNLSSYRVDRNHLEMRK